MNVWPHNDIMSPQSPCPVEDYEGQDRAATVASLKQYLWSIIYMPSALRSDIIPQLSRMSHPSTWCVFCQVALPHKPVLLELPCLLQPLLHRFRWSGRVWRKSKVRTLHTSLKHKHNFPDQIRGLPTDSNVGSILQNWLDWNPGQKEIKVISLRVFRKRKMGLGK